MTMENPGHEDKSRVAAEHQPPADATVQNPSRRRFNRAGVGASAVVMTLASRSVLADTMCRSPSGFDSLQPSTGAANTVAACAGKPPSWWLQQHPWPVDKNASFSAFFGDGYPGLYAGASAGASTNAGIAGASGAGGEKWFDAFSTNRSSAASESSTNGNNGNGGNNGNNGNGAAILSSNTELLLKEATVYQAMAGAKTLRVVKSLLAAFLNAKHKYNDFPRDEDVVRIFQEWQRNNYYEVRAGVKWYEADIIKYLASANSVD